MTNEEDEDWVMSAVERRKTELERELVCSAPECHAKIVRDLEACGSLLEELWITSPGHHKSATLH